jgi:hypothetical protein
VDRIEEVVVVGWEMRHDENSREKRAEIAGDQRDLLPAV